MRRIVFCVSSGLLMSALSCAMIFGQATAQISGAAKDQSGAVLPGVEISMTQTDTGISRTAVTNETGSFVLPNLPLGPYRFEASLPGFRTYVQTGIVLQVNSSPVINVVLQVGQVSEQVEVEANAALVETRSSTVGVVMENARILELPLNGRNVTDLITASGGAVRQAAGSVQLVAGESPLLAIGGSAGFGVDYTLDGANHMNYMSGTTMAMPFPDAMQEFKVESSGAGAQSRNASAVAAVTKSGTNELHGDLFEFLRNDLFNATTYFAAVNPATGNKVHSTLKRNQFGGTVGGAMVKNKLFFFGGYQGTTIRSDPADVRTFIPTAAMLAGDWTTFTSPACNAGRQVTLRAPFVNNRIDPTLYNKQALFIVNYKGSKPFPTANSNCGEVSYGNKMGENDGVYVGKVDYQKSDKHSLFGRVLFTSVDIPNPWDFNNNLLQNTGYRKALASSYTAGSTYLISANTVQAFRLAVNRNATHYYNVEKGQLFNWCDIGVNIYCEPIITRINNMSITGAFPLTSGFLTGHRYVGNSYSANDDVSFIRGSHQLAFGISVTHGRQNNLAPFVSTHQFTFSGASTGLGLADFMLGFPSQLATGRTNTHRITSTNVSIYAGDSWKATSKVTLNYGLRWEPYIPEWAQAIYNFDHDRFVQGIKSKVYVNAPAGLYYRGDPGFPENGIDARFAQFAPRMGLAWDVSGDGKTSVRASYSLGYIALPSDFRERYSGTGPWGGRVTLSSPIGGLSDPYRGIPGGDIFPYELNKDVQFVPYGWVLTQPYDLPLPYTQSWNLTLQRQVGADWLVTGTYLGTNLIHVRGNTSLNPAIYIPGGACTLAGITYNPCSTVNNTDQRRLFSLERSADGAKYGYAAGIDGGGTQSYHGMVLSVARRAARGVVVNANYTLSHCIGPYATLYGSLSLWPYETYTNPTNRDFDRGNCDSDRRHIFNVTGLASTPKFSNRTLRIVATGWRFAGIYKYSSGDPLNILAGTDRALNGIMNQRANQISSDALGDARPFAAYLNPKAFAIPDLGTIGNIGHNSISGPGIWGLDMAVSRVFNLREMQRLELRVEAYNLTNSFKPGDPNVTVSSNTFGVIRTPATSGGDPRILQFALKYVF
jgi:hypothetical protein